MMQVKHLTITHKKDLTVLVDDLSFVLGSGGGKRKIHGTQAPV